MNDTPSCLGGDLTAARAYVHARFNPSLGATDLQFWLFYAYNGPGTLQLTLPTHACDRTMAPPLGEHYGDWEHVTVRISADGQLSGVYVSQHSGGEWYEGPELQTLKYVNGSQVKIYSSRNGHANYIRPGKNIKVEFDQSFDIGLVKFQAKLDTFNFTADGGRPFNCASQYEIVAADTFPGPYPEAGWLDYPYRWGPENSESNANYMAAQAIAKACLGFNNFATDFLAKKIVEYVYNDDKNGPTGPKWKESWFDFKGER